jgi:hypothetical protein
VSAGSGHQRENHDEVLHNQPSDSDAALFGCHKVAFLQGAQQHDRTCHRQCEPEHEAGPDRPSERLSKANAEQGGADDLHNGAGNRDRLDRQEFRKRKVQSDAEHQKDDADFGEFGCEVLIGDESGREGADGNASEQVPHDW